MSKTVNLSEKDSKKDADKACMAFVNLTHPGHSCLAFPLGSSLIASFALKNFGEKINVEIFKDPNNLAAYLEKNDPKVVCFSNYYWNFNVSYEFAKRIKKHNPRTVIVFGGPNYPIDVAEQREFMEAHPAIDFYIWREGEKAFVELLDILIDLDFDPEAVKEKAIKISNCNYLKDGRMVEGDLIPRITELDEIPSPYLTGLLDKFFDGTSVPLVQTARGCPFSCTYCQEGEGYFNRFTRFPLDRVNQELDYIAERIKVPNLLVADSNFGMYSEDIDICRHIAHLQEKYGWPGTVIAIGGKNKIERLTEAVSIVNGRALMSAAVQSTDEEVLKNIKRQNISPEKMVEAAKKLEDYNAVSFSEIILCLPGDSKESHFKSVFQMIDAGMNVVRIHQLLMLPGSELSSSKSREQYGMVGRFRVQPCASGTYRLYGEEFNVFEIDEICVANKAMSCEDYVQCRLLNLTVELFYNNGIFYELVKFLKRYGVSASSFIMRLYECFRDLKKGQLADLRENFVKETNNLWENRDELEELLQGPDALKAYNAGEFGLNEQLVYRGLAFFKHMDVLHENMFNVARELLKDHLDERCDEYMRELFEFSLLRKQDLLSVEDSEERVFHYDFVELASRNFNCDPFLFSVPEGIKISIAHDDSQKDTILKYVKQYGKAPDALGTILSRSVVSRLYRKAHREQMSAKQK